MANRRAAMKEMFMGDVQQATRPCAPLHCCFVVEPLSPLGQQPPMVVIDAIRNKFNAGVYISVHMSTESKVLVSFTYHSPAVRALRTTGQDEPLYINGVPYRFASVDTMPQLMRTLSDQRVYLVLKGLPLHLRSDRIVEQLLAPYCVLDYVPPGTRLMDDPSEFACYARSERRVPIPSEIMAKVGESEDSPCLIDSEQPSIFISCYSIGISVEGYTYGEGTGEYSAYASDDEYVDSVVVSPAQSYISYNMLDKSLISSLSEMVVMVFRQGTSLSQLENVEAVFDGLAFLRVKVRKLTDTSFLLSVSYPSAPCSLYSVADGLLSREIRLGEVTLQRWTTCFGSIGSAMFKQTELSIKGLPCNYCTPVIVEYILGPFCLVKTHYTQPEVAGSVFGKSIFSYKCSAWYEDLARIPRCLQVKCLPLGLTDLSVLSTQDIAMLKAFDVSITARIS